LDVKSRRVDDENSRLGRLSEAARKNGVTCIVTCVTFVVDASPVDTGASGYFLFPCPLRVCVCERVFAHRIAHETVTEINQPLSKGRRIAVLHASSATPQKIPISHVGRRHT
jgi:hypothetical protein